MKKAKIMLLSIVVFAVVGAALASKSIQKFSYDYCVLTTVNLQGRTTCSTYVWSFKTTEPGFSGWTFYYVTTTNRNLCTRDVVCTFTSAKLTRD